MEIVVTDLQTRIDGIEINDKNEYVCLPDSTVKTDAGIIRVHLKQENLTERTMYITRHGFHSAVRQLQSKLSFSLANKQSAEKEVTSRLTTTGTESQGPADQKREAEEAVATTDSATHQ